ncbi:MAG: hypothetical protein V7L17_17315 [Nostoc sp.]
MSLRKRETSLGQGVGGRVLGVVFKTINLLLRQEVQHFLDSLHPTPHTPHPKASYIRGLCLT